MQNIQNLRIAAAQIQRSQKSSQSVSKSAGLTLLESMIALSIFAVVIWAAMANYTSANATQAASQMATELQSLRANVKDLYSGQGNFGSADAAKYEPITASLIAAKKVPSTLNQNTKDGKLTTGTGGAVVIEGKDSDFTITYSGVPKALCISALTGAGANGWIDMKVNGDEKGAAKYTPSAAADACEEDTENTIIFRGA
jgi:prepilin-type N-terminal cleavage/methylation domain-containing protein